MIESVSDNQPDILVAIVGCIYLIEHIDDYPDIISMFSTIMLSNSSQQGGSRERLLPRSGELDPRKESLRNESHSEPCNL